MFPQINLFFSSNKYTFQKYKYIFCIPILWNSFRKVEIFGSRFFILKPSFESTVLVQYTIYLFLEKSSEI